MSNIPLFSNQKNVDDMKAAYTAQGDALGSYNPAKPAIEKGSPKDVASPYTSTTSTSGGGGRPTGGDGGGAGIPDPTPAQIDTTANRPGRGPISYGQANQYLGGSADIIGATKGNIRDASAQGSDLFNLFMTDAQTGGPGGAFGADQQQTLGAAVEPGRSEVQRQAGADVLNTQYTGPQDLNMGWTPADAEQSPSPASQVGANLARNQSQANALSTGFGVASQLEQAEPGMTSGERVAEARRYRTDPELQQRTRDVQQTADISVENFKAQQRQASAEAQRQQDLAKSHRVEGREHLESTREGMTEPARVEADRLNDKRLVADEAHKRYLESGDLDALIAETPEGMLSPEVQAMADSGAYRLPKEAKQEWRNIWRSNKYSSIADMPTMTFGTSFKGEERNRMDADWVRENLVGKEGWEEISGIVESYADGRYNFQAHRAQMQRHEQYKNSQGGSGPWNANPEEGWSQTKKAAYREFEAMERLARARDRELKERFGKGGDLEAYRPMGVLAANFGEFAGTATHPFIKADIQEVASIANVLEPEDKERVNNITSLLNAGGQAIAEGDQYELGKIGADLMSYIEVNDLIVSDRVERMGIAASDWSSFRSGLRRMYKKAKRRRRWGIIAAIAAIVLTVVTMGAAAPTLATLSAFGYTATFSMLPAAMLAAQVASLAGAAHELYQAFTWEMGGDDIMSAPGVKYD